MAEVKTSTLEYGFRSGILGLNTKKKKTVNTRKVSGLFECFCVARKKPIRRKKTKPRAKRSLVLWLVASSRALIFQCDWL